MAEQANTKRRVGLLDELRGIFILLMVIYHGLYDLVAFFNVDIPIFYSLGMQITQGIIAGGFIFIAGISGRFSRSNRKRGLICFGLGMVMTIATWFVVPDAPILFGILHLLGTCMVLFSFMEKPLSKIPAQVGFVLAIVLFVFFFTLPQGKIGLGSLLPISVPQAFYQTKWLFWLGLPSPLFSSVDYFPLLPWAMLFFAGSYTGIPLAQNRGPAWVYSSHIPFLATVGKHTLWIYVLHQPIIMAVLWLIF